MFMNWRENAELPKHTNSLPPFIQTKADNKVEPYKKVNAIIISNNATNGDMIKVMFPELRVDIFSDYVQVMGKDYEFRNEYPLSWWNAPYKIESEGKE